MTNTTKCILFFAVVSIPIAWYAARDLSPPRGRANSNPYLVASNAAMRAVPGAQRVVEVTSAPSPPNAAACDEHYRVSVDYMNSLGGIERTNLAVVLFPVATSGGDVWAAIAR